MDLWTRRYRSSWMTPCLEEVVVFLALMESSVFFVILMIKSDFAALSVASCAAQKISLPLLENGVDTKMLAKCMRSCQLAFYRRLFITAPHVRLASFNKWKWFQVNNKLKLFPRSECERFTVKQKEEYRKGQNCITVCNKGLV